MFSSVRTLNFEIIQHNIRGHDLRVFKAKAVGAVAKIPFILTFKLGIVPTGFNKTSRTARF